MSKNKKQETKEIAVNVVSLQNQLVAYSLAKNELAISVFIDAYDVLLTNKVYKYAIKKNTSRLRNLMHDIESVWSRYVPKGVVCAFGDICTERIDHVIKALSKECSQHFHGLSPEDTELLARMTVAKTIIAYSVSEGERLLANIKEDNNVDLSKVYRNFKMNRCQMLFVQVFDDVLGAIMEQKCNKNAKYEPCYETLKDIMSVYDKSMKNTNWIVDNMMEARRLFDNNIYRYGDIG